MVPAGDRDYARAVHMGNPRREPRPLVASPSLLRALGACGATSIDRLRGSRKKKPTLSLVALRRLEEEIGARLHDDVLVLLALRDPVVELFTGIGEVRSIADAADEYEAPDGWVCISMVYSDPVGELVAGAHGGPYYFLAVPREPEGDEARVLVGLDGLDRTEPGDTGETLCDFIDRALHEAGAGEWQDSCHIAPMGREQPLSPAPALVAGRRLKLQTGAGERVTHPKFGEGEVIRRMDDGEHQKIIVRFADGERTLLARFVKPAPP